MRLPRAAAIFSKDLGAGIFLELRNRYVAAGRAVFTMQFKLIWSILRCSSAALDLRSVFPGNASLRIQIFKVKAGGRQPLAVERNNDHAPILSRGAPKNSHGCCCVAA
jgi:hypothetical protein